MKTQERGGGDFLFLEVTDSIQKVVTVEAAKNGMADDTRSAYEQVARRLAKEIWMEYADPCLAAAAYISLWPIAYHKVALSALVNSDDRGTVGRILRGFEALRRLRVPLGYSSQKVQPERHDLDLDDPFATYVLGQIKDEDPAALVVYVYQAIASTDRVGTIRDWTQSFRSHPSLSPHDANIDRDHSWSEALRSKVQPIAELLGVHELCRTAANIADILSEPEVFQETVARAVLVAGALEATDSTNTVANAIQRIMEEVRSAIRSQLGKDVPSDAIRWEWHHVASIGKRTWPTVPGEAGALFGTPKSLSLGNLGFVSVDASSPQTAYEIVCAVHKHFRYQQASLVDFMNPPRDSGYCAIHTALEWRSAASKAEAHTVQQADSQPTVAVTSRFDIQFSLRVVLSYGTTSDRRVCLELLKDRHTRRKNERLTVFTAHRDKKTVENGSTVLDFALRISSEIVPYVCAAEVNGNIVSNLLHPLAQGDTVRCITAAELQLPPQDLSAANNSVLLRKIFYNAFSEDFRKEGWKRLTALISAEPIQPVTIDEAVEHALKSFLHDACKEANSRFSFRAVGKNERHDEKWWLTQTGILAASTDRLARFGVQPKINDWQVAWLARKLLALWAASAPSQNMMVPDPAVGKPTAKWKWCDKCLPRPGIDVISIEVQGVWTVYHRQGADCAMHALPLRTIPSPNTLSEYFVVVEATDHDGLLRDLLRDFAGEGIPVTQVHAERFSGQQAIVRVRTNLMSTQNRDALKGTLKKHLSVKSVLFSRAGQQPDPAERFLPPRQPSLNLASEGLASPYVAGPPVAAPHQFYGRDGELRQILREFEMIGPCEGRGIAIHGPLKVGKTSLAQRFFHDEVCRRQDVLTLYLSLTYESTWQDVLHKLLGEISRKYPEHKYVVELRSASSVGGVDCWQAFLERLRERETRLALILDEVYPWLTERCGNAATQADFLRFWQATLAAPVLVTLVGPAAALTRLPTAIATAVRQATQLPLEGLSLTEAGECLRAIKCVQPIRINVGDGIVRKAWVSVNGNPFWLNHLGNCMWQRAKTSDSWHRAKIEYGTDILREGLLQLATKWELFSDRFALHLAEYEEMGKALMDLLFRELHACSENDKPTITHGKIREAIALYSLESQEKDHERIEKFISCVIDCGGLARLSHTPDELSLAAPILKDALRHRNCVTSRK